MEKEKEIDVEYFANFAERNLDVFSLIKFLKSPQKKIFNSFNLIFSPSMLINTVFIGFFNDFCLLKYSQNLPYQHYTNIYRRKYI